MRASLVFLSIFTVNFPKHVPACSSATAVNEYCFLESRHPPVSGAGGSRAVAYHRRIMLSRKSAVISKLPATWDSLMRSPLLVPVYLPFHFILSFSLLLSVSRSHLSQFNGCFFAVKAVFCLCICVRASVWSQHVEKRALYVAKGLKSWTHRSFSNTTTLFFQFNYTYLVPNLADKSIC